MLTNKKKKYLKSLAIQERAIYQIGKEGLNDNIFDGINTYLSAHELIKISLLKSCPISANEAAIDISRKVSAEVVQIIGKRIVLYRKSKKGLIQLP